jgi:hypothetical protein
MTKRDESKPTREELAKRVKRWGKAAFVADLLSYTLIGGIVFQSPIAHALWVFFVLNVLVHVLIVVPRQTRAELALESHDLEARDG